MYVSHDTRRIDCFLRLTGSQRIPGFLGVTDEGWTVHTDGSLLYRGSVVVSHLTDLREEILRECYCSRFVVHLGGTKMYQDLCRQYYWSEMKRHVRDFVPRCLTCQQVKAEHQKPAGLLQPLEVAEWKW